LAATSKITPLRILRGPPQTRSFAAFPAKWKSKVRKDKLAAAKKKQARIEEEKKSVRKLMGRKPTIPIPKEFGELIEPADTIEGAQSLSKKDEVSMLSILQAFAATSSPFVYLGCDDERSAVINQCETNETYWDRPVVYGRKSSVFEYLPPSVFNFELPNTNTVAEVAFLGRSNVGKSSLMNALMQEKLARTSKQPGRTQLVSYYGMKNSQVNDMKRDTWRESLGFLVDLPGYGYAVGPDEVVDDWQARTQDYILDRSESGHLRRLYLLVDSRHGKAQQTDFAVMKWLDENAPLLPYTVVLTKADGVRGGPAGLVPHLNTLSLRYQQSEYQSLTLEERRQQNQGIVREGALPPGHFEEHGLDLTRQSPIIHITSAKKNMGLLELWKSVCYEFQLGPFPRVHTGTEDFGERR